ncbi:MAG: DNA primase, partial [Rhizobiales bacterium]|nr:DNA primase [Hyphomicrobiales bacterium]
DPETLTKMALIDPETGEALPSKKIRGSKRGGHVPLSRGGCVPRRLVIGEGIETVLSVRQAELETGRDLSQTLYWSAADLGNLGGAASETIPHPTEIKIDRRGAKRRLKVPGSIPAEEAGKPALMPPDEIDEIILLGDGDSDPFATSQVLQRASTRWARPGRSILAAWAPAETDFNDLLRAAA